MNESLIQRSAIASAFAVSLMLGSTVHGAETPAAYSWTEIVVPELGPLSGAQGLNDLGQVVVSNLAGDQTGIYSGGVFTPLPAPPAGYRVAGFAINNAGIVVGQAFPPSDPDHGHGFILIGSRYAFFSRPGWRNTAARGISASGLVTGYSYNDAQTETAGFVYNPTTRAFTDATPPGSGFGFSVTQGMNAHGVISGDGRSTELGRYGFVWRQQTNGRAAPFLARFTIADGGTATRGINDDGVTVGFTNTPAAAPVGFVGDDIHGFRLLVPPGGDAAGAQTVCEGINNARQVVCDVTDAQDNTRAFIGSPPE